MNDLNFWVTLLLYLNRLKAKPVKSIRIEILWNPFIFEFYDFLLYNTNFYRILSKIRNVLLQSCKKDESVKFDKYFCDKADPNGTKPVDALIERGN